MFARCLCFLKGHISTGTFLWWMCDRCCSDFTDKVSYQKWEDFKGLGDCKVTRSNGLFSFWKKG